MSESFCLNQLFPVFSLHFPLELNSSRLLTESPSDFKLGRFWTSLARLDQQTPCWAPISLELLMGPQTLRLHTTGWLTESWSGPVSLQIKINYRGEPEHDSETDMTFNCSIYRSFRTEAWVSCVHVYLHICQCFPMLQKPRQAWDTGYKHDV